MITLYEMLAFRQKIILLVIASRPSLIFQTLISQVKTCRNPFLGVTYHNCSKDSTCKFTKSFLQEGNTC